MRLLILLGILGLTLPAFAVEGPERIVELPTPEKAASTVEPASEAGASEIEPGVADSVPTQPPVSADAVSRKTFTTAVDRREPVDSIISLGNDRDRIYYFTEFVGIKGRRLIHRWEYEGTVVAEVPIAIGGSNWRAYSSKNLDPSRLGEWTVSVVDESGHVVSTDSFVYEKAAPAPVAAASVPASTTPAGPSATPASPEASPAAPSPASGREQEPARSAITQP